MSNEKPRSPYADIAPALGEYTSTWARRSRTA
jgi:hypothetical protein